MNRHLSRRDLLKAAAALASGVGLSKAAGWISASNALPMGALDSTPDTSFLPLVHRAQSEIPTATLTPTATSTPTPTATNTPTPTATTSPPPTGPRVVHIHSNSATSWDFGDIYYGNFVDQDTVNAMADRGVVELTGTTSVAQAWQTLVPGYVPGQAIAIKVNFNNCRWCNPTNLFVYIDALVHPVNALVRGLIQAYPNLDTSDIWVYDAAIGDNPPDSGREIPQQLFRDRCLYPGVRFFDQGCNETAGYASPDPTATVTWHNPQDIPTPPDTRVTDVLVDAHYVIDMPIMKKHVGGITLGFKNHFGSIPNCAPLHDWIFAGGPYNGGTRYNPLVDIYRNAHILGKTVLTVGDALFGNWEDNISKPSPWTTFGGGAPNSLFFGTDPVAIDCVMCDFIAAETWMWPGCDDYLVYAAACGLGTYERGDPWGSGYDQIDYLKFEL